MYMYNIIMCNISCWFEQMYNIHLFKQACTKLLIIIFYMYINCVVTALLYV